MSLRFEPYQEFLAEREELLRHKWLLSERQGGDIGFEGALLDWARHHRPIWRQQRNRMLEIEPAADKSAGRV